MGLRFNIILLISFCLLLSSCKKHDDTTLKIDLSLKYQDPNEEGSLVISDTIELDSRFSDWSIKPVSILAIDNRLILSDITNSTVWIFNWDGSLYNFIDNKTLEFNNPLVICDIAQVSNNQFAVFESTNQQILIFDDTGSLQNSFEIQYEYGEIECFSEKYILLSSPKGILQIFDLKGRIIKEISLNPRIYNDWLTCGNQICSCSDSILISQTFNFNLYSIHEDLNIKRIAGISYDQTKIDTTSIDKARYSSEIKNLPTNRSLPIAIGSLFFDKTNKSLYIWNMTEKKGNLFLYSFKTKSYKRVSSSSFNTIPTKEGKKVTRPLGISGDLLISFSKPEKTSNNLRINPLIILYKIAKIPNEIDLEPE